MLKQPRQPVFTGPAALLTVFQRSSKAIVLHPDISGHFTNAEAAWCLRFFPSGRCCIARDTDYDDDSVVRKVLNVHTDKIPVQSIS
jgi:hypothetical protein